MSLFNGHASKYDKIYIAAALIPLTLVIIPEG